MTLRLIRGAVVGISLLACVWLAKEATLPVNDSVEYWSAARLALHRQNPYDTDSLLALERQAGYARKSPLIMWNPPWVLPFFMPLSVFSYRLAQKLWLVLCCACVALSVYLLWKLYGRTRFPSPMACLLIAIFTPLLVVLAIGQVGPLVLLGITGFLWFEQKQRYGLAGMSLFLLALKPHLVFLFWMAVSLWLIKQKHWRMLVHFLGVAGIVCGATILAAPQVFSQYYHFWLHNPVHWNEFPTVSGMLSHLTGSQSAALALIPPTLASLWLLLHWVRFRQRWNWQHELPVLLVVSLVASPYAWFFDGVILLPALMQIIRLLSEKKLWLAPTICYAGMNLAVVLLIAGGKNLFWYSWVAPMWVVLYFWSRHRASRCREAPPT